MSNSLNLEIDLNEELKKVKTMKDLTGKDGLMQRLMGHMVQQILEAEISDYLGRNKYERDEERTLNSRNGYFDKTVTTGLGEVDLKIPRDRNGDFEPQIIPKHETVLTDLDDKVIALYGKGMSTRDITETLNEMYGSNISASMVSTITDRIMTTANDWQTRILEDVYPIVFLDAIHYKVRTEGKVVSRAAYICLGINKYGFKDILGIWIGENEGAKFWLGVVNDLRNRGIKDILIACVDGLKGFPDAIKTVFPDTEIQTCVIHQIRNSYKYISYKDSKRFMENLKCVYKADTEELALEALEELNATWGTKYKAVVDSWYNNWDTLATYFKYPPEIRKLIYTTNTLEGFNRQLRKVTKVRTVFPTDDSLRKSLYLATLDIMKKWTMPVPNWAVYIGQFAIIFDGRIELN